MHLPGRRTGRDGRVLEGVGAVVGHECERGVVAGEKGYIEVSNYPRANKATITYTADGHSEEIALGETAKALEYEVEDMQATLADRTTNETLGWTRDVTSLLSEIRNQWGMVYPFEQQPPA